MEKEIQAVLDAHSSMVYRLAYSHTGNRMDADDVFQDVFLKLVEADPQFRDAEHQKAWLIRTTINRCNSLWRSARRRNTAQLRGDMPAQEARDTGILEAVWALPTKYRSVIHLFYWEDMSVDEISRLLKRQPSTIRTQLTRARRMLGEQIKEEGRIYAETSI